MTCPQNIERIQHSGHVAVFHAARDKPLLMLVLVTVLVVSVSIIMYKNLK